MLKRVAMYGLNRELTLVMPSFKLISFDLDGTLTPPTTLRYVLKRLKPELVPYCDEIDQKLFNDKMDYVTACLESFNLLRGLRIEDVENVIHDMPLYPGAEEAIRTLRNLGYHVILLTDNPDIFCRPLVKRLGFSGYVATEMLVRDGVIMGIRKLLSNKLTGLQSYIKDLGISLRECIHIGDWLNDVPVFRAVGFSIAINPKHPEAVKAARLCIKTNNLKALVKLLPQIIHTKS
ncbi:MAG: HAD family hydrolase [Candidatus Njordarchaeales archaeon]